MKMNFKTLSVDVPHFVESGEIRLDSWEREIIFKKS